MTITARYPGQCSVCGDRIRPGDRIEWDGATRETRHARCQSQSKQAEGPIKISGGSGYGYQGWTPGQVIRSSEERVASGGPAYLTVVTAGKRYYREDGLSFGVGDDSGYIYWATCREATAEEAQPLIEKIEAARKAREREAEMKAAAAEIRRMGERPAGWNEPEGRTVNIGQGQTIYGGGEWFVIGTDYIWYVENNGGDGDSWDANNVRTGGAGAIGWRVAYTPEMEARITGETPTPPTGGGKPGPDRKGIMERAHHIARTMEGDYQARMSYALRTAWAEYRGQTLKEAA